MRIYIPSRGRHDAKFLQGLYTPLNWLSNKLLDRTSYVVRSDEFSKYKQALRGMDIEVLDAGMAENLGDKREFITRTCKKRGEAKFMMCDDDVMLYVRKDADSWNLRVPKRKEINALFEDIEKMLDKYAMVGISSREGNNRLGAGAYPLIHENTRAMRMYAFNLKDYTSIYPNRMKEMADFDTVLQLLRKGRKNAVIGYWAQAQPATQYKGGCSIYRTNETHETACKQLRHYHGDLVRLRKQNIKAKQKGLETRTEVTVAWAEAYVSGTKPSALL